MKMLWFMTAVSRGAAHNVVGAARPSKSSMQQLLRFLICTNQLGAYFPAQLFNPIVLFTIDLGNTVSPPSASVRYMRAVLIR